MMPEEQNNSVEPESGAPGASDTEPDVNAATPDGEPASEESTSAELGSASLEEQSDATRVERDESKDRYLRAQAELENYKRRTQRELAVERQYAALPIVRDLLPEEPSS